MRSLALALLESLRMALADLAARPLRSFLTVTTFVLSMVIAVVLISSGKAIEEAVAGILSDIGEGQMSVVPGRTTGIGGVRRSGRQVRLRYKDVGGIDGALPSFFGTAAYFDLRGAGASSWKYSIPWSPVRAVAPDYHTVRQLPLSEGRWFNREEEENGEWVTVLNQGLRKMIFRDHPAVGNWVEWRGRRMMVVGVVKDEALFPFILFVPYQTVSQLADARYISGLIARPRPDVEWERATRELRRVLGGIGGFDAADESALEIETNQAFASVVRILTLALRALVATIGLVGLFLGGLGVSNMMSIAVTERTREIGLRKALGASRGMVFLQIFLEAALLLAAGGAAGIGLGSLACGALGTLPISSQYSATVRFDPLSTLLCLSALAAVGLVSALLPARRAAALAPVEALRWE
jgi:putative ABC transport system permease protein